MHTVLPPLPVRLSSSSVMHMDLMLYSTSGDEQINVITGAGEKRGDSVGGQNPTNRRLLQSRGQPISKQVSKFYNT